MKKPHFLSSRWRIAAVVFAIAVLGGCAYIDAKQSEWIFNPVQGEWRGYRGTPDGTEEKWIPVGRNDEKIHAWWSPAGNPDAPVLLYLHGARWNLTGSVTRIPRWNKMGFSVLAIDYRGFGKSVANGSGAPTEATANEDAGAAWKYLAMLAPNAKRYIFGHSLGGSMAISLALKAPDVSGLILEGAFTSVPDMISEMRWGFLPVKFLVTQRFDNMDRIDDVKVPVLIAHGTRDDIVPFSMGEKLFAAAKSPKRFFRAEGGSHHNLTASFFDEYRQAIVEHFGLTHMLASASTPASSPASASR